MLRLATSTAPLPKENNMFPIEDSLESNRIQINIRTNDGIRNTRGESGNLCK